MRILREIRSPNFENGPLDVQFVVIHYTACEFDQALSILTDPTRKVSAHFLIAADGRVFELVQCLEDKADKAWHAGRSQLLLDGKLWSEFNNFSIGIELENLNGNLYDYSIEQYQSLFELLQLLKTRYAVLNDPLRIVGHEQIAGFRGKCDPGRCFDWERLYGALFEGQSWPKREALLQSKTLLFALGAIKLVPKAFTRRFHLHAAVNAFLERGLSSIK